MNPQEATRLALSVPRISYASFGTRQGKVSGVAVDNPSGVEFDVREDGHRWNVNDDEGRDYRSFSLRKALKKACEAQR